MPTNDDLEERMPDKMEQFHGDVMLESLLKNRELIERWLLSDSHAEV